jgi:phosphatidate cytidylyltransferase
MRDQAWREAPGQKPPPSYSHRHNTIAERASPEWLKSLSRRVITAIVAIPIVLAVVWYGGWVACILTLFLLGLGIYELKTMFEKLGYHPLTILSFIYGTVLCLGAMISPPNTFFYLDRQTISELTVTTLVLGTLAWLLMRRQGLGTALLDWALTLVMTLYLAWPLSYLLTLRGSISGATSPRFWWLLIALFGVWAFDSAAFFVGRFFGRHHLAPTVSPGKTWEGVIGGYLLTLVAVFVFSIPMRSTIAWYHVLILGTLISFAATIGDLAESLIKRQANVKDSGKFFWGHGGVLDRIDSLLFAAVVVYFYVALVLRAI